MADTRQELEEAYRHPYARWLPLAWAQDRVAVGLGAGVAVAGATALWELLADGGAPIEMVTVSLLVAAVTLGRAAWITLLGSIVIRNRTASWRPDGSEIGSVRRRRPHAAEADPDVAHEEYAVAVDESGHLITWRFRPLRPEEDAGPDEILVAGRPRYAARQAQSDPFEPVDAAVAAEQLALAQQQAADLESAAADRARRAIEQAERQRELAAETTSTARALRGITGQSRE